MNHIRIVPGLTKLRFDYTDRLGQKTQREGLVIKMAKGPKFTYVQMEDQLRGKPRNFSVNRMKSVVAVTY